ncbi:MAG: RNase adapter RapZ [Candidatus Competibacterales bacterium]
MIIVSGLSGAGKSNVLKTLEDLDYYCVDNLPLNLLKTFATTLLVRDTTTLAPAAVGIDARNFREDLPKFPQLLDELRALGLTVEVFFIYAVDDALVKRYSETRRRHPLHCEGSTLIESIHRERELLNVVLAEADLVVDTTYTNVHELRAQIHKRLAGRQEGRLALMFESFGFKRGVPIDADFVFDVRCLPNPHWEPNLRPYTGQDVPVMDYLRQHPQVQAMEASIRQFLCRWLSDFETADRSYLTVALGCTGGKHRSVYLAEALGRHFAARRPGVQVRHRELQRGLASV